MPFDGQKSPSRFDGEALLRARHGGQRVLLAEDNPVNREVAEELLRSAGLEVETAWNGERAVEMALSRRYDLILMDMQMPKVDGLQASREIRERAGRGTPIIAMTANAFAEDRQACLAAGMNDHVAKPVDPAHMYATLLRWMPLRTAESPDDGPQAAAVEAPGVSLRERLATIDGFDVDVALQNVGNRPASLIRILTRFVETYAQGLPELRAEHTPNDPNGQQKLRNLVHSTRGALSVVGAVGLLAELKAIDEMLRSDDWHAQLREPSERVHQDMVVLIEQVRRVLAQSGAEATV